MKPLLIACAALALAACSPAADKGATAGDASAAAGEAEAGAVAGFDQAAAEAELLAWARGLYGTQLIEPLNTFFGDYTGDGANDALAFAYYDVGGSGAMLNVSIFRNEDGRMVHEKQVEVFGAEPRDAAFSAGQIKVTTLMPGPNDAHCCPTQPREWTVATN